MRFPNTDTVHECDMALLEKLRVIGPDTQVYKDTARPGRWWGTSALMNRMHLMTDKGSCLEYGSWSVACISHYGWVEYLPAAITSKVIPTPELSSDYRKALDIASRLLPEILPKGCQVVTNTYLNSEDELVYRFSRRVGTSSFDVFVVKAKCMGEPMLSHLTKGN